jgi:hypothetical protein
MNAVSAADQSHMYDLMVFMFMDALVFDAHMLIVQLQECVMGMTLSADTALYQGSVLSVASVAFCSRSFTLRQRAGEASLAPRASARPLTPGHERVLTAGCSLGAPAIDVHVKRAFIML